MILGMMFILSVVLVIITSWLAVTVSPLFFLALLVALALPAWLTVRSYKSPNLPRAASERPVHAVDYRGR